jgi:hypothetical protein
MITVTWLGIAYLAGAAVMAILKWSEQGPRS